MTHIVRGVEYKGKRRIGNATQLCLLHRTTPDITCATRATVYFPLEAEEGRQNCFKL